MTRAVVELSQDASPVMARLSRSIDGCAYDPRGGLLGFHFEDMSVLVEGRRLTAIGADGEAKARGLVESLRGRLEAPGPAG